MEKRLTKINYTNDELQIIDGIRKETGLDEMKVCFLVLMTIRGYVRSKRDLASILMEYPQLDDQVKLEDCIDNCIAENLISQKTIDGIQLCYQSENNYIEFINSFTSDEIKEKLNLLKSSQKNKKAFFDLGSLSGCDSGGEAYVSFISRLKGAQRIIWLPMLNTDAHEETVKVLKERASCGVKINILMADYESVVKLIRAVRGSNISKWVEQMKNTKNIEIRIYKDKQYAQLASSVIIDDRILRLPIYDSYQQKSTDGNLVEFNNTDLELNIVQWVKNEMERAWNDSVPAELRGIRKIIYLYMRKMITWAVISSIALWMIYPTIPKSNEYLDTVATIVHDLLVADVTYIIISLINNKGLRKRIKKIMKLIVEK